MQRSEYLVVERRESTVKTEVVAGVTTFLTMAYIIFVNPAILSEAGMDRQALVIVTCIISAVATAVTGLVANAPIAMAPGMGLNAFLAYSLVLAGHMTWQTALGVVFLSGLLGVVLTVVGLRKRLVEAIPASLVSAISVGIGLFITFIGLRNMGIIIGNKATLVTAGPLTGKVAIGLAGLLLMAFLEIRKVKGAPADRNRFRHAPGAALWLCGKTGGAGVLEFRHPPDRAATGHSRRAEVEPPRERVHADVHGYVRQHRHARRLLPRGEDGR